MSQTSNPSGDFMFSITSIGSILISIAFTHIIVIVLRENSHEVLLPLLIIVAGIVMGTSLINERKSHPFHTSYLAIWLMWLMLWCFRIELEQHENKVVVLPRYNQACHLLSYLGCLAWPKVNKANGLVKAVYCVSMFLAMAAAEDGPMPESWLIYEQLFSFAFIYFFASFFTDSPEFCALWCLFFDYPITLFLLAGFQIMCYIVFAFFSIPDPKEQ
jgi:hypothetical protein